MNKPAKLMLAKQVMQYPGFGRIQYLLVGDKILKSNVLYSLQASQVNEI